MSLVTQLARLLERILWSVRMGNICPVNRVEIQE